MKWISIALLLFLGCALLMGCDSELRAQEQAVAQVTIPDTTTVAIRDASYWKDLVYDPVPAFESLNRVDDPFEPPDPTPPETQAMQGAASVSVPMSKSVPIEVVGLIQGRRPMAVLRHDSGEQFVEAGDMIAGYTVQKIGTDRVVLIQKGQQRILEFEGMGWTP